MGVRSICQYGYPSVTCRCMKTHDPVKIVPCESGHLHKSVYPRAEWAFRAAHLDQLFDEALNQGPFHQVCPRCRVSHMLGDFRGDICGWCADDLEFLSL